MSNGHGIFGQYIYINSKQIIIGFYSVFLLLVLPRRPFLMLIYLIYLFILYLFLSIWHCALITVTRMTVLYFYSVFSHCFLLHWPFLIFNYLCTFYPFDIALLKTVTSYNDFGIINRITFDKWTLFYILTYNFLSISIIPFGLRNSTMYSLICPPNTGVSPPIL